MYLSNLQIRNAKLLRDFELSFAGPDGEPRMWTVLIGENGSCKTTVLQCIAMAASGHTRTNQVADIQALRDTRTSRANVEIDAWFADLHGELGEQRARVAGAQEFRSTIKVLATRSVAEGAGAWVDSHGAEVSDEVEDSIRALRELALQLRRERAETVDGAVSNADSLARRIEWVLKSKDLKRTTANTSDALETLRTSERTGPLVLAYGVSRLLPDPGTSPRPSDLPRERIAPLFGSQPIIGTDFVDFLEERTKGLGLKYVKELRDALVNVEELVPRVASIELRGAGGAKKSATLVGKDRIGFRLGNSTIKLPATWLSQGYQSTMSMIADILGHAFWDAGEAVKCADVRALVLVDELDMHLHPSWQRGFARALKNTFPKVQFVATTHSPLVLTGLEEGEVAVMEFTAKGHVRANIPEGAPATFTGSELFAYYFGVTRAAPRNVVDDLVAYMALNGATETNKSATDASALRARLEQHAKEPSLLPELAARLSALGIEVPDR